MAVSRYVCIICPNSCEIEVEHEGSRVQSIKGANCRRGEDYVRKELSSPERGLTTSIPVVGGHIPLVSVKTSKPIPKEFIMPALAEISKAKVKAPVKIGDVVIENLLGLGVDVVVTKNIEVKGDKCFK